MIYIFLLKKNNSIDIFFWTSSVTCVMVISSTEKVFLDIRFLLKKFVAFIENHLLFYLLLYELLRFYISCCFCYARICCIVQYHGHSKKS